jgi:hypothetical protein
MSEPDLISRTVQLLNDALILDAEAIKNLINARIPCNKALAGHPTIQVGCHGAGSENTGYRVGLLGIINGIFGVDEGNWGYIGAEGNLDQDTKQFLNIERFVDLRQAELRRIYNHRTGESKLNV